MEREATTIALIQTQVTGDADQTTQAAVQSCRKAASQGARLICLPEMYRTPYFCQKEDDAFFKLAESIPGPSTESLGEVAKETESVIVAPLFEKRAPGLYHNSLVVLERDGSIKGHYRKMHIPDDPGYYEKFYFAPGDLGFEVIETSVGKLGCLICWDQWFPEAARLLSLKGAEVLIYPTAIGWHPKEKQTYGEAQQSAWQTIQRSHAIANGLYVAAINRVGLEKQEATSDGIEFWGHSFLCNPQGVIEAQAPSDRPDIVFGKIERPLIEETRNNWPFFRDRRIDAYQGLDKRFLDNA